MLMVGIASVLNVLLLALLAAQLATSGLPDDPGLLFLVVLLLAAPVVNIATLWYLVRKGKSRPQAMKEITEKLDHIQSLLEENANKS